MIDRFQYLSGYLRIKVWGFSPERFMNLCSNRDILLWDVERDGESFLLNISLKNFFKLRPIARKTGVRVAVLKRYGLPFFTPMVKKRKAFAAGFVLAVFFWIASANFVWDIRFEGNRRITEDLLEDFLETENIRIGILKKRVDIDTLEKDLRKQFPEITWVSVKLSGVRLLLDIKENDAPIIEDVSKPETGEWSNLISDYDGVIVSIIVRNGIPKVTAGDEVFAGDVLVEGTIPIYNDDGSVREYSYVNADADIVIEHTKELYDTLSFNHVRKEYTGREKKRYFLRISDKEIKMPGESPYLVSDSVIRMSRPQLFERLSIPIFWGEYTYREYRNVEYRYSIPEVKEELQKKLNTFLASLSEKGVQIIEKNVKIDHNDREWVLEGQFRVRETTGRVMTVPDGEADQAISVREGE